ncbi:acyl-CoA mutase large subunit family protein [Desulfotomaculum copahuensis]|uniref:Methylmalonyl-CoA mutase n=1 Tax=Desulfotomaculum copahuensis TaxID=1838280 RepID=A0A1B7LAI0_9FIRM|nr:methylmalonyl-CoA mutase family protein [Desulfotomaculum copahuensis]OAT79327.1 methylmalonyl-CoA mutase [Desulfotomaculum copahuensis]
MFFIANEIKRARDEWEREVLAKWLRDHPETKETFTTKSGLPLERVYAPEGTEGDYLEKLNFPGQFPFTRGVTPTMYRSQTWVMGQYSGYGSAEEANQRFRYLIEQGQTGFSIALDLPTQIGLNSDHPLARGEVGRVGVALDSLQDVETLFQGIPFHKVRQLRTTANAIAPIAAAMFIAFAEKNGIEPNSIKILIQNDILKEYIGRGTYIFPPRPSVKLAADVVEYCAKNLPNWTPMSVCGYHIRDSGSTAVQELAYTLANAIEYVREVISRGLTVDEFVPKLYVFLASDIDLLEEVAKFRALRRLWARLMKERFCAKNPESMRLNIFAYTLGGSLTAQQPLNNVVRVTIEALAAVLGGVQTLATSSYDEALGLPTEEAVTIALRTQQIIASESGVTGTVDPLGGSYAVEALTDAIEEWVMAELQRIDSAGGTVSCIEEGIFQKELSKSAYEYQKQVESRERVVVGVNRYVSGEQAKIPVFRVDESIEQRQVARLQALKNSRDGEAVRSALLALERAARENRNIIPETITAIKTYATVGEICGVLRKIYGEYRDLALF